MTMDAPRPAAKFGPLFWLAILLIVACLLAIGVTLARAAVPILPQQIVDTTYQLPPTQVRVPTGSNLQAAIDAAPLGTALILPAGATFSPIRLPAKAGTGWIYILSDSALPGGAPAIAHNRILPTQASQLAKISGGMGAAVTTAPGAHHYRFVAIEGISTNTTTSQTNFGLVQFDGNGTTPPHHIILDRTYLHGTPTGNLRRAVTLHGTDLAVIDSTITEVHEVGADSQAIVSWDGAGPFKIENNDLQAAGENIMFGGARPSATTTIPSDIEILGNYIHKPLAWQGSSWSVKNLLEIKNAQRLRIEGNLFENNWVASQNGLSITFTPRGEGGSAAGIVADVTFRSNQLLNCAQGFNLSGKDDSGPSDGGRRVLITNNSLALNKGTSDGRAFQPTHAMADLQITQNTVTTVGRVGALAFADQGSERANATGFVFTNNLASAGEYGFSGSGNGEGTPALNGQFAPGWVFTGNVIYGSFNPGSYPPGNSLPATAPVPPPAAIGADPVTLAAALTCTKTGQCAGGVIPPPVDTTPPAVTLTSPVQGAQFTVGQSIPLSLTANEPLSASSFAVNGNPSTSPFLTTAPGTLVVVGKGTDLAGNVGTSAPASVTVVAPPPPPTNLAPGTYTLAAGGSVTVSLVNGVLTVVVR